MPRMSLYLIESGAYTVVKTPEERKARALGKPPFPVTSLSGAMTIRQFLEHCDADRLVMILDPEFWYVEECWRQWLDAEQRAPCDGMISVPLGNQNPAWRLGMDIPVYLTLPGLEKASRFRAEKEWLLCQGGKPEHFCVATMTRQTLAQLPSETLLAELGACLASRHPTVRVFCRGWLHAFNALGDAGCRHDLLAMCDWHGMVLEFGCGTGLMAKTCKQMVHGVTWIGVDRNHQVLKAASVHLDLAIHADATRAFPFAQDIFFDRVVCGDFLEHLPYPWLFLDALRAHMAPGGLIIASFPNVGHWSVVEDLLVGRWDEAPAGIHCVTHLRFGTKISWQRWLEEAGWRVLRWEEERVPLPENWAAFSQSGLLIMDSDSLATFRYRVIAQSG